MGFASISRGGACGPLASQAGDVDAVAASKMAASNPLTPETTGCPDTSSGPVGGPCVLSGCSSSSSFVDTTSSRSEGDDADIEDRVRKDLSGLFSGLCVAEGCRDIRGGEGARGSFDDEMEGAGNGIWRANDRKEPILMDNDERFCLLPVKYHKAYEYYKMAQASYWTVEEVDLSQDKRDWDKLTKQEKHFISYVLAFFAASDGIVLENLAVRFMQGTGLISCVFSCVLCSRLLDRMIDTTLFTLENCILEVLLL